MKLLSSTANAIAVTAVLLMFSLNSPQLYNA